MAESDELRYRVMLRMLDVIELDLLNSPDCADRQLLFQRITAVAIGDINLDTGVSMRDQYNVEQAGSVGPKSRASHMVFSQANDDAVQQIDLGGLAADLDLVRAEMRRSSAGTIAEDAALLEVGQAQLAARDGKRTNVMDHLAKAGQLVLDAATKVGTQVTVAVIKHAMGLES